MALIIVACFLRWWVPLLLALAVPGWRWRQGQTDLHERNRVELRRIEEGSAADFVRLTADLLRRDGCISVDILPSSGNSGLDVLAVAPKGGRIAVGCYRHTGTSTVDSSTTRSLHQRVQTRFPGSPTTLVLVTAMRLTSGAGNYAAKHHIVVVEQHALTQWIVGHPPFSALRQPVLSAGEVRDQPLLPTEAGTRIAWIVPLLTLLTVIVAGAWQAGFTVAAGWSIAALTCGLDAYANPYPPPRRWSWWPLWAEASLRLALAAAAAALLLLLLALAA
ncbi:restriction endonuclease [Candidatus Frankia nodulisporulans]|uniref:restriction endonuclease n=4 Tax=Candidatus Frankia nodulisporulans TaxID=2060052 RepID=UPI0013CFA60A|nr:restriction endonuclease [Candidatus Frankia nodulisporulans]